MQALSEQTRMLTGVVAALHSREEALVTMQMLTAHLAAKKARADTFAQAHNARAVRSHTAIPLCIHS
jgi:hypothetical protein